MLKSLLANLLRKRPAAPAQAPQDVASLLERAVALHRGGDAAAADALYAQVLEIQPDQVDAVHLRGVAAIQRSDPRRALPFLRRACELRPGNAVYLSYLGEAQRLTDDLSGAFETLEAAVAHDPQSGMAWNSLGAACIDLGMASRAAECYRKAMDLKPANPMVHSNLLFAMNFVAEIGNAERYAQHLAWAARHADGLMPAQPPLRRGGERRLRIGYVSPDLRQHAMAPFIAPVFERHDRARFEVYAYSDAARPDQVTASLRASVDAWRDVAALGDEALAAMVRGDAIDILVDLAGHTGGNRLLAFARKPAPMQVTMLGYPFSTGMAAMDYRVTDAVADAAPDAAACNRERLLYLQDALWCFRPWPAMPEVTPLPAASRGHVTFVSLNNPGKLNDTVLATWARILQRLPAARLRLMLIRGGQARDHLMQRLARLGIDAARVTTHERAPSDEFWRLAQDSDIALDPFPCNGGATTCESLWLGLPVVALAGEHFVARASTSILKAASLGDLACASLDQYVDRACALGADLGALAGLRAAMRERLRASALLDEERYVRGLERQLVEAWQPGLAAD